MELSYSGYSVANVNDDDASKKLYLVALYAKDKDGIVTDVEAPKWVVETSEDRAKTHLLNGKLKSELNWNVKIIQTINF